MTMRPGRDEAAEYYFKYIDQVPDGNIVDILDDQAQEISAFLQTIPEARAGHRYAEGKWTIAEAVNHINDTERVFAIRAFWFARAFDAPLPGFDQDVAMKTSAANDRPLSAHVHEFASVRAATLDLFRYLPDDAWMRRGIASDLPFTVRALAWITAGHVTHHARILKERYLTAGAAARG